MNSCVLCNYAKDAEQTILFENDLYACLSQHEENLVGSCVIIPKAHRKTVFDLTPAEWEATKDLIDKTKAYLDTKYSPDGYTIGWNCGLAGGPNISHAHLHIIPRHADEPYAGRGIRSWIKSEENRRQ
ncbi:MAG: HIT family protein [Symbiobacteriaceae bacterium]|nr:HIT family protein [Symbiobacteriaceae bacterium]